MNRLKRLFSPSALAATVATGMLVTAALADIPANCYSAGADTANLGCSGSDQLCSAPDPCFSGRTVYWCCAGGLTCGGWAPCTDSIYSPYCNNPWHTPGGGPYAVAMCCHDCGGGQRPK